MRVSHVARSWSCRAPPPLSGEIGRPEACLDVGIVGSDDINERRSTKHELHYTNSIRETRGLFIRLGSTHYDMLPYLRMLDGVRKTRQRAGASNLPPKGWDT